MGRPKKYDRELLIDRAIELFRRQGFNGTSTAELVAELGVNRKSMYAEFGSKQGLFEAALSRYGQVHLSRVLAPLEAPDAGAEAIRQAFVGYGSAIDGPFAGQGCLMCNTAVERAALDAASGRHVAAYLSRLTRAFRRALDNARRADEVDPAAELDELAGFMTAALIGVAACVRAKAEPATVHAACRVATAMLGPRAAGV